MVTMAVTRHWACIVVTACVLAGPVPAMAFMPAAQLPTLASNRRVSTSRISLSQSAPVLGLQCKYGGVFRAANQNAIVRATAAASTSPSPTNPVSKVVAASLATLASLFGMANGLPASVVISLLASSVGFISAVYFVGYGYGLSMIAMGVLALRHFSAGVAVSQLALLHACVVIAWGTRIFGFLLFREAIAWPGLSARTRETNKKFSPSARFSTWIFVSVFYALLFSPVLFHLQAPTTLPVVAKSGLAISAVGLLLEAQSDSAKSAFKKNKADDFISSGLYKICRHPNYLGELIFWTGNFVTGVGSLTSPLQWSASSVGLAGIYAIMLKATESLEKKQALKYGDREDYRKYVQKTPQLIPFMGGDDISGLAASAKDAAQAKAAKAPATTAPAPAVEAKKEPEKLKEMPKPAAKDEAPRANPAAKPFKEPQGNVGPASERTNYAKNKKPWDV